MNISQNTNEIFLSNYDYSPSSTMSFSTNITETKSGTERRNANWREFVRTFDIKFSVRDKDLMNYIQKFYASMFGVLSTFPYKDWLDYEVDKTEGVINSYNDNKLDGYPTCKLYKNYSIDNNVFNAFKRISIITKPDQELPILYTPFKLYQNGKVATFEYTLDYENAILRLPRLSFAGINSVNTTTNTFTTSTNHGFAVGDKIYISDFLGTSSLNDKILTVLTVPTLNTFVVSEILAGQSVGANGVASKYLQDPSIVLTWEGNFLNRVRFVDDDLVITFDAYNSLSTPIKLKEVKI